MRHIITTSVIASVVALAVTGCDERTSMRATPNRDGHAYVALDRQGGLVNRPMPAEGEMFYTCVAGDTIVGVAKKHSMTADELIVRNELKNAPVLKPGQLLVVKDPKAGK